MMSLAAGDERPHLLIKRQKGGLVAIARGRRRAWRIVAEGMAMTGVSCAILACGCEVGFYSNQRTFDAQSERFAEATIIEGQRPAGLIGVPKGCFGHARLELFNPTGFVFANYVCEVEAKSGLIAANLGMRRDPDTWRMTGLYVDEPTRSQRAVQAGRLLVPAHPGGNVSARAQFADGLHSQSDLERDWRETADRMKGAIAAGAALDTAIGAS